MREPTEMPRIGVYAIAKQEARHVADWYERVCEADWVVLYDTGSTDTTVEIAAGLGIEVHQMAPGQFFRFDIARNTAMSLCPDDLDYLLMIDLDERIETGWRDRLATELRQSPRPPDLMTAVRRWDSMEYDFARIHSRYGWTWRRPVHEELSWQGEGKFVLSRSDLVVEHLPDNTKERSTLYTDLMRIGVAESPDDAQLSFWFGRELIWNPEHRGEGRVELQRFLDMPHAWLPEKARCCELLAHFADSDADRHRWLLLGVKLVPWRREPWYALAQHYRQSGQTERMHETVRQLLDIHGPVPHDYVTRAELWDDDLIKKEFPA